MQKLSLFFICNILLFSPGELHAQTLTVDDTIVGVSTRIELHDFPSQKSLTLSISSPKGEEMSLQGKTNTKGNADLALPGYALKQAGIYTIHVSPGGEQSQFTVHPESIDRSTSVITAELSILNPDGTDAITVQVTLTDQYGNPLTARPVALISNRTEDVIEQSTKETNEHGLQYFVVRTQKEGVITLRAMDLLSGNMLDDTFSIRVQSHTDVSSEPFSSQRTNVGNSSWTILTAQIDRNFDIIDHFEISVPSQLQAGIAVQKFTIRAVDRNGNAVENYTGNVTITTSDPSADVPFKLRPNYGVYAFQERDRGERIFALALTLYSPGTQTIRIQDEKNPTVIFGEAEVLVTGQAAAQFTNAIRITSHKDGDTINSSTITLEGKGPSYIDIKIMGGIQDILSNTDNSEGTFSETVELNSLHKEFTLRVQDSNNPQSESPPIHLFLDNEAPEIYSIMFSPEKPITDTNILAVAISEPGLRSMTMHLRHPQTGEEETFSLTETANPGTYQTLFSRSLPGSYQPRIRASDGAGNVTEIQTMLTVNPKPVARVDNLQAIAEANSAALSWNATPEDVDGYRIYIGEEPGNFLYNLDTGRPTTKANVSGLQSGKTYYFAVTALKGNAESAEKSNTASVIILGLALTVTPQDSALLLQWPSFPIDLPLSSFVLEYGTQRDVYTEKRTLNGELRAHTLRDLINDITYYLRLTPIDITGSFMQELTATGEGTPRSSGVFQSTPSQPLSQAPEDFPAPRSPLPPELEKDGLPSFVLWILGVGGGTVFFLYRCRRNRMQTVRFMDAIHAQSVLS